MGISLLTTAATANIPRRAYAVQSQASAWEEIWEAGPYFENISAALEGAKRYVLIAGWQIDSRLVLDRRASSQTPPAETLKEKLIRRCNEEPGLGIFLLLWDHSYFYCLWRELFQGRVWLDAHPRIHVVFDNKHPFAGAHHEKTIIIDGQVAFCGGIDLCDERWDGRLHLYSDKGRSLAGRAEHHDPYHDLAVKVQGPVVVDIQQLFNKRWQALSNIQIPLPLQQQPNSRAGRSSDAALSSTYISQTTARIDLSSATRHLVTREIDFLFRTLIGRARRRIIIEGQYYWSGHLNKLLIEKIKKRAKQPIEVIIILCFPMLLKALTKYMASYEMRLLSQLQEAAARFGTKLTLGTPISRDGGHFKHIYVHSKLMIIDDEFLCIGSANLANRALRLDTEMALTMEARSDADRTHIRDVAATVLDHWNSHNLCLEPIRPQDLLIEISRNHPFLSRVNWQKIIDPTAPFLFRLKNSLRRKRRPGMVLVTATATGLILVVIWLQLVLGPTLDPWAWFYALILFSAVWLPLPFITVAIMASAHLGATSGSELVVHSIWINAFWIYAVTRIFPSHTIKHYQSLVAPKTRQKLLHRFKVRSFEALVQVLVDIKVSIQSKLAFQGLYFTPLPWFIIGALVVIPGGVLLVCQIMAPHLYTWLGPSRGTIAPALTGLLWLIALRAATLSRSELSADSFDELD